MKYLSLFLIAFTSASFSFSNQAGEEFIPEIMLQSSTVDSSLVKNKSIYEFRFYGMFDKSLNRHITYSIDGEQFDDVRLKDGYVLEVKAKQGKHSFSFFYNENYFEVHADTLAIRAKHRDVYNIQLSMAEIPVISEKPVIYLYPEKTTYITVELDIKGINVFTYPISEDSWKFIADPSGDLHFGDDTYNYLFWEAEQRAQLLNPQLMKGFVVEGDNTTAFLEDKLTQMGFTSKERADFITYWAPKMQNNDKNFVHFKLNEECEQFATMNITPKPDHVYRVYMQWAPYNGDLIPAAQDLPSFDREGFVVLEWGGQEVHVNEIVSKR